MFQQIIHLERIRSSRDFREIYRVGQKITGKYFLLFLRRRSDSSIHFGVTATRRLGNAVSRNRAKRLMREAVRLATPQTDSGFDLVLVARTEILQTGMNDVKKQLLNHLRSVTRINNSLRSKQG
ncbi:ribonuclease P protein component [bacterium]|nr:ribonuclease P protein component [candidate division CSSED10-310 bacterium]